MKKISKFSIFNIYYNAFLLRPHQTARSTHVHRRVWFERSEAFFLSPKKAVYKKYTAFFIMIFSLIFPIRPPICLPCLKGGGPPKVVEGFSEPRCDRAPPKAVEGFSRYGCLICKPEAPADLTCNKFIWLNP